MIPNIFVSSTIEDLQHLRDGIRDALVELSYNPVMSEYGEVGYLPATTAEDSCYLTLKQCQLAIILIGKRYGHISENGLSITHNECNTAKACKIPIITLVDAEIMSFKKFHDSNPGKNDLKAPGMDAPERTFTFIDEISSSRFNNGILTYNHVSDARMHLKRQLAHIFGEFLKGQYDPIKAEVRDVLSEIKTLRHEISSKQEGKEIDIDYLNAVRFLLEDKLHTYKTFIQEIHRGRIDGAISELKGCSSISDFIVLKTENPPDLIEAETLEGFKNLTGSESELYSFSSMAIHFSDYYGIESGFLGYLIRENRVTINPIGLDLLNSYHEAFLKAVKGVPIDEI